MSRSEVLSPEGLRLDGRRPGEIRRLRCQLSAEPKADGSAYLEQGNTKVLVTVCGPHEVSSQRKAQHDRAVLHCTYSALPFSGGQHKSHPSRTADSELASSVRSVFDPVVQTQLYPRTQIDVSITLLQADGGMRAACINATTLALIDAGIAMEDFVCACTAGAVQSALLLDMNGQEDMAGAELTAGYLPRSERVGHLQLESKVPLASADELVNFAIEGCRQVFEELSGAVQLHSQEVLATRGPVTS